MTRRAKLIPYSQIKRERVESLEPGRVPLGALTIIAGLPGLGKSQWTIGLAGRLSRGELPCGEATAILATAEDAPAAVVKPRLYAVRANMEKVVQVTIELADDAEDGISLPADTAEIEECVAEEGARLVVVDPLVAFLGGSVDSWKDAGVRQALAPLAALAARQGCAVVGVMHLNKSMSSDPFMRLGGSVGFGGAARSVLVLGRDPDDAEAGNRRVLAQTKNNYGPLAPSLLYEIEPILLSAEADEPEVETSRLALIGESDHDARSVLQVRDDDGDGSALSEAQAFLLDELAEGPVETKEIKRAARDAGHTDRTLERAKQATGVQSVKIGFNPSRWAWKLPDTKDANPVGALREAKDATDVGGLRANTHEQTKIELPGTVENVEGSHSTAMASFGDEGDQVEAERLAEKHGDLLNSNGRRVPWENEEQRRLASDLVARERIAREDEERERELERIRVMEDDA